VAALVRVIADERERPSGVPDELSRIGAMVNYQVLDVADYVVREYAIERKSSRDFVSSLFSGRLFDQANRLTQAYETPLLVIEGDMEAQTRDMRNPRSVWGGLMSVVLDYKLACFFTKDHLQTAEFIWILGNRDRKGRSDPLIIKRRKPSDLRKAQISICEALPTVGPQIAERLLARFGSLRGTFSASMSEMAIGAGVGRSRALTITKILDAPYKASKAGPDQSHLR